MRQGEIDARILRDGPQRHAVKAMGTELRFGGIENRAATVGFRRRGFLASAQRRILSIVLAPFMDLSALASQSGLRGKTVQPLALCALSGLAFNSC